MIFNTKPSLVFLAIVISTFSFFFFNCGGSSSLDQTRIEYNVIIEGIPEESNYLPKELVDVCLPIISSHCKHSYAASNDSRIIKPGIEEQLQLVEKSPINIPGEKIKSLRIRNTLNKQDINDSLRRSKIYSQVEIESYLEETPFINGSGLFIYSPEFEGQTFYMLNKDILVFNSIEVMRDSIGAQLCDERIKGVTILYDFNIFNKSLAGIGLTEKGGDSEIPLIESIPEPDLETIKAEAEVFTETFYDYLNNLSSGLDDQIDETLALFIDNGENVIVQTNNKGSNEVKTWTLEEYLVYFVESSERGEEIKIELSNIEFNDSMIEEFNGDFRQYKVTGSHNIIYKKYKLGKLLYSDQTGKGIELITQLVETDEEGKFEWKVFLSNITVEELAK